MKISIYLLFAMTAAVACNPNSDSQDSKTETNHQKNIFAIRQVMLEQQNAWSNNDLEGFMQGYWKSDSLKFYGQAGLTKGWQQTLDNYKKSYPSSAHSGELFFELVDISPITKHAYWVMGRYNLKRSLGDTRGSFIVIFKKIEGKWKIIADMSCSDH